MPIPHVTTPSRTYHLRGFAMFRFALSWLAVILAVLGALWVVFRMPPGIDSLRTFFSTGLPLLPLFVLWCTWPMVWKIETRDDGLVFRTLFQKRFVPWSKLTDVVNECWETETFYVVHCRDQRSIRFPSEMNQQDELLSLIKQYVPDKFLTVERESHQGKGSLFNQAVLLFWSCGGIALGAALLISRLAKLLSGDLRSAVEIVAAMLLLVVAISIGTTTISRAKSVRVTGRGLLVRTWLSEFEVTWQDIKSVRRFPFGRTMVIASRTGWFLLGQELSRFDELSQYITDYHGKLTRKKSGTLDTESPPTKSITPI